MVLPPPLDTEQVDNRIKRFLDYCATRSQCCRNEQVEHTLVPVRFRPVPSNLCTRDGCFPGNADTKKYSVNRAPSYTHFFENPNLENLPVELYFELARYVHPIDLLNLARTSKSIRSILLAKRNQQIWKIALYSIPLLPPCPKDMSHPSYTALLFDEHCWACGSSQNYTEVDYFLRLRLCPECFDENVVSGATVEGIPDAVRDVVTMSIPRQMEDEPFHSPYDDTDVSPLLHKLEDFFFKPELHAMVEKLSSPTVPLECVGTYLLDQATYLHRRLVMGDFDPRIQRSRRA
ncbi:hypothetical protein L226DRAFT_142393 [Lentinus tigrinus ALCF2SS1-7]|uniref:uncharacterized protein n=1 Tax=Lentinus tigrinus ALCF2SS1-7 TaxID=1328758 RepID=UPI0011663D42|nr:hypothetical protein L226DRAFT_142393 [Lentinus tigrinus ALCF2SS1-7]